MPHVAHSLDLVKGGRPVLWHLPLLSMCLGLPSALVNVLEALRMSWQQGCQRLRVVIPLPPSCKRQVLPGGLFVGVEGERHLGPWVGLLSSLLVLQPVEVQRAQVGQSRSASAALPWTV